MAVANKLLTKTNTGSGLDISDVFSTYVYTGNGSTQDIVNGINLADEGGMVWTKPRDYVDWNALYDTERGAGHLISTNSTSSEVYSLSYQSAFSADSFSVGSHTISNRNNIKFVSWTFRKAPKFFDVVTYTGDYTNGQAIPHNLGTVPGMIIIKRLDSTSNWTVYHRTLGATEALYMNMTDDKDTSSVFWNNTEPTSSHFYLGQYSEMNASGSQYVAYLFAHNEIDGLNYGDGSPVIKCGSYVGNGSVDNFVELGFEPQYLLVKSTDLSKNWFVVDMIRGMPMYPYNASVLYPNLYDAEVGSASFQPEATGFNVTETNDAVNGNGNTYIYMAIARSMKEPTTSDEVFAIDTAGDADGSTPWFRSNFAIDMGLQRQTTASSWYTTTRLNQGTYLNTDSTSSESSSTAYMLDYMDGWMNLNTTDTTRYSWMWKRAKGFFDVVCYTGDGVAGRTVNHNLGVVPEMMWVKRRDASANWVVNTTILGNDTGLVLENTFASISPISWFNYTSPSETTITLGSDSKVNSTGGNHIAYLFASKQGISKVGSYTGNGTSQTIDCGFTTGAKFVLIKNTSVQDDWYIWDSVRGIVYGTDPYLALNTTANQDWKGSIDILDPDVDGFIINQESTLNLNTIGYSYIYYAIAN